MSKRFQKGFTLAELLVVVAIIAILVAIAIPVFTSQIHKAKVSADLANLRSYYSEIQTDYIETGKYNDLVPKQDNGFNKNKRIVHLNGTVTMLQGGFYSVARLTKGGYQISYYCDDYMNHLKNPECLKVIG